MLGIIAFLVVLSVLILIHEAGHYLASRFFGVKADEFGYGLPPRLIGFVKDGKKWKRIKAKDRSQYKNTIWSINWLPIGGFVRIKGEGGEATNDPDSFQVKPIWQRFLIIAAGVIMNWVLAIVLLSFGFMIGIPAMVEDLPDGATIKQREVTIIDTLKDGAAAEAGIEPLDVVVRIGDVEPKTIESVQESIVSQEGEETEVVIRRGDEELSYSITPKYMDEIGKPGIGIALVDTGVVSYPPHLAIVNSVVLTGMYTKSIVLVFIDLFRDIFNGGGETVESISGPVGIAVLTGRMAERGILQLIQFTAVLSINLAVLNFLPIPALDGGRAIFLIIEAIRRRPVNRRLEALIHNIAFLILIGLIILISIRDVGKFFGS
jgi:regulator of sigma E protease